MTHQYPERIWITAAGNGIGHAMAVDLLEQGCHVAISGYIPDEAFEALSPYSERLQVLQADLRDEEQARQAREALKRLWGGLDGLIVNAGGCDYLEPGQTGPAMFEPMILSQLAASGHALQAALPLLEQGRSAWVLGLVSPLTAQQVHEPSQPATARNNLVQLFEIARPALAAKQVDLTLLAPQSLHRPGVKEVVLPEVWEPQEAARAILERLAQRPANLVMATQAPHKLWPLPQ